MGETVMVDGEEKAVDEETTIGELKQRVGASEDDIATVQEGNRIDALNDDARVLEEVPKGATVSFQPADGRIFGSSPPSIFQQEDDPWTERD